MSVKDTTKQKTIEVLSGQWELREGPSDVTLALNLPKSTPLLAKVPGDVHLDLMRAGRLPDPLLNDNIRAARWVGERAWWYRRSFKINPQAGVKYELVFEGLCYLADIWLNGRYIGRHKNMHRPFCVDVSEQVAEHNTLDVRLLPFLPGVEKMTNLGWGSGDNVTVADHYANNRGWMRKAAYSFGWDWAQALPICGIWRDAYLRVIPAASIDNLHILADIDGRLKIVGACRGSAAVGHRMQLDINVRCKHDGVKSGVWSVPLKPRGSIYYGTMHDEVKNPHLWWPVGMGEQALYCASATLHDGEKVFDYAEVVFGFRRVRVIEPRLGQRRSAFRFLINNEPVFMRGANWVPPDIIPARITADTYRRLIDLAIEAGLNYFRFWGGGVYAHPCFYDLCDEKGIMIWQDMMFGNKEHPDFDPDFVEECHREIEYIISSLRNHPSIIIWCGNNEVDQVCQKFKALRPDGHYYGERLFHQYFPNWIGKLDKTRPYRASSGCVGRHSPSHALPTDPQHGVTHLAYPNPFGTEEAMDELLPAFANEWYAGSPPLDVSLHKFLKPVFRKWDSPVLALHNFLTVLIERGTFQQIVENFAPTDLLQRDFKEICKWFHIWHAETMVRYIEHFRRWKWVCSGNAFWMFNSAYTALDWSLIDYYLLPKPAFYATKRANQPLLPIIAHYRDRVEVFLVNDIDREFDGLLEFMLCTFDGHVLFSVADHVHAKPNRAQCFMRIPFTELGNFDAKACFIKAKFTPSRHAQAVWNYRFLAPWKFLKLPSAEVSITPVKGTKNTFRLSTNTLARWVTITPCHLQNRPNDNFFDLLPGEVKEICFPEVLTLHDIKLDWANRKETANLICCGLEPMLATITLGKLGQTCLEYYNPTGSYQRQAIKAILPPGFALDYPSHVVVPPRASYRCALTLKTNPAVVKPGFYKISLATSNVSLSSTITVLPNWKFSADGMLEIENLMDNTDSEKTIILRYLTKKGEAKKYQWHIPPLAQGHFRQHLPVTRDVLPYSGELLINGLRVGTCWLGADDGRALWHMLPKRPFASRKLRAIPTKHASLPDLLHEGHGWQIEQSVYDNSLACLGLRRTPILLFLHYNGEHLFLTVLLGGKNTTHQFDRLEVAIAGNRERRDVELDIHCGGEIPKVVARVVHGQEKRELLSEVTVDMLWRPYLRFYCCTLPWSLLRNGRPQQKFYFAIVIWGGYRQYVRVFKGIHIEKNPAGYGEVAM